MSILIIQIKGYIFQFWIIVLRWMILRGVSFFNTKIWITRRKSQWSRLVRIMKKWGSTVKSGWTVLFRLSQILGRFIRGNFSTGITRLALLWRIISRSPLLSSLVVHRFENGGGRKFRFNNWMASTEEHTTSWRTAYCTAIAYLIGPANSKRPSQHIACPLSEEHAKFASSVQETDSFYWTANY